jgi:hypothetical protein
LHWKRLFGSAAVTAYALDVNAGLPSKHKQPGEHMLRHSEGTVVSCSYNSEGVPFDNFEARLLVEDLRSVSILIFCARFILSSQVLL